MTKHDENELAAKIEATDDSDSIWTFNVFTQKFTSLCTAADLKQLIARGEQVTQADVAKAVKTLAFALGHNEDLYFAYQSNIAMPFVDCYADKQKETGRKHVSRKEVYEVANEAAKQFLNLLIQSTTQHAAPPATEEV